MKKTAGILAMLMLVTMLGGCYKSDTTLDFNTSGGVEVTSTLLASREMYEQAGISGADELIEAFAPETIEMYSSMYGMAEKGERLEMTRVDAAGNEIAEGAALPEDGSMVGTRLRMRYKSLADALNSFTLINFLRVTPIVQDDTGYGVKLEEQRTLLGTKYTASGKINVYGGDMYKAEYDAAEQGLKDKIADASASITFKFPLSFSKSNANSKGLFGQSLTWTASANAPDKEVYFEVTMLNPVILGMGIVILGLLIALILVARKKKAVIPDAYFVDEEGNPIPIYDEEEELEEETEGMEESEPAELTEAEDETVLEEIVEEMEEETVEAENEE